MVDYKDKKITVIRHRGTPDRGQLPNGRWVYKQDKFWVDSFGNQLVQRFIPAAPYDDHFLYELPEQYLGSSVRCSCGSMAVIAGYSAYEDMASAQGLIYVCYQHANFGVHLTGGSTWI